MGRKGVKVRERKVHRLLRYFPFMLEIDGDLAPGFRRKSRRRIK